MGNLGHFYVVALGVGIAMASTPAIQSPQTRPGDPRAPTPVCSEAWKKEGGAELSNIRG